MILPYTFDTTKQKLKFIKKNKKTWADEDMSKEDKEILSYYECPVCKQEFYSPERALLCCPYDCEEQDEDDQLNDLVCTIILSEGNTLPNELLIPTVVRMGEELDWELEGEDYEFEEDWV